MNHRTLFFILLFLIIQPISAIGQSLERQPEYQPSSDCITIDGRTYKISPEFRIPYGIDIDSPVKLNFTDDTDELLSIERLVEDDSNSDNLEYHFGIVNAISKPGMDLSYLRKHHSRQKSTRKPFERPSCRMDPRFLLNNSKFFCIRVSIPGR